MKKKSCSKEPLSQQSDGTTNGYKAENSAREESQTPLEMRFIAAQTNLSAGRQRLLKQILDEPQENFYLFPQEMGRHYAVDSAAIVRTIQAIDYKKNCCDDCRNIYKSFNS